MPTGPLLVAEGLKVRRAEKILAADLSFSLAGPGVHFLTGPNGVGKSTLLLTLAGQLPPDAGRVLLQGQPLYGAGAMHMKKRATIMVYMPQSLTCPDEMTVLTLVGLGRAPYLKWYQNVSKADDELSRKALLNLGFRLPPERWMGTLSGGEKQMVWLAQGLVQNGQLWLLDEPTQHLDAARREFLFNLLHRLATEFGKTLLVATHELESLARQAHATYLDMLEPEKGFIPCTPAHIAHTLGMHKEASGLF